MVGGAPQPPHPEPTKRTRSAFKENPDQTRFKQKDREYLLCKCYQLIELCTNVRQKSAKVGAAAQRLFFYQLKINCKLYTFC